jgi:ParB-like nuclease domain
VTKKPQMDVQRVAIAELVPDSRNARKGDVEAIAASLAEFGQHRPLVIQRSTMRIISGNHTALAASSLGWTHVDVTYVDDDDEKAIRRGIADNATADKAKWDDAILKELLDEVGTDVPGITRNDVGRLYKELGIEEAEPIYPLLARPGEEYDYIMFWSSNVVESTYIQTLFGDKQKDWKNPSRQPVRSRILPFSVLYKLLTEAGAVPVPPTEGKDEKFDV